MLSAGDAAHTLAIEAAGTVKKFVGQMNRYAAALGLTNTHYANPIGLDSPTNYSSALDLAALTEELLKIPAFAQIADSREATLRSMRPVEHIHSINELLEMAPWVTGVKTGHTWKAGYVMVGSGSRHGVKLIAVDDRRADRRNALLGRPRTARMGLPPVPPARRAAAGQGTRQAGDPLFRRRIAAGRRPLT